MSDASTKPIIFISYAHADEPDKPTDGEVQWLSFVQSFLQPAVKGGIFDIWADRQMKVGAKWEKEIEEKLRICNIFLLLVSRYAMASEFIINEEIRIVEERQAKGEEVYFCPLYLTPTPKAGLAKVRDKNLRPRDLKPFSSLSRNDREQAMADVADDIAEICEKVVLRKPEPDPPKIVIHGVAGNLGNAIQDIVGEPSTETLADTKPAQVHISGLPETAYERLVGRDAELKRLDEAWDDPKINILSLIAEGGAGKSALVNEWLKRLQAENYRSARAVLGWSFFSQGTRERVTSADSFLDWALEKLGVKLATTGAVAKGEAIAEALMQRRVLLALDGIEPLQHGPDGQTGQLKDPGLRALLRRFAATAPGEAHGLVVLTSRLPVADIARWKDGAAPVVDVERLSAEAGAALLRDNGVWGTRKQLEEAARDFGGHPLALGLLASFLTETQTGDVRRRDIFRSYRDDSLYDEARRVMESYENEWLAGQPVLLAIMLMVGLFDRPAAGDCLKALRAKPAIAGLTDPVVDLSEDAWRRAVARLREVHLLAPIDSSAPNALDAHPLVREWFGERLRGANEAAWKAANSRIYDHLRRTAREGASPKLADLAPLYQAIPHGCRAGRHQEALDDIYRNRICRRLSNGSIEFYSKNNLGAFGSDLAVISWFFDKPYETPIATLNAADQSWVFGEASVILRAQGRIAEAASAMRAGLQLFTEERIWVNAATLASNLSESELLLGYVAAAVATAEKSVSLADVGEDQFQMVLNRTTHAEALQVAGQFELAERLFADAEQRQGKRQPKYPLLYSWPGYRYCDFLLSKGARAVARDRAMHTIEIARSNSWLLSIALDALTIGRANLALAVEDAAGPSPIGTSRNAERLAKTSLDQAVDGLRASGENAQLPRGLLARAAFRRCVGDSDGSARDLDEVEEIAEPGPMRLFLCDAALERARVACARIEAFAPLNGLVENSPPKPALPDADAAARLKQEAEVHLDKARKLIAECGYHRRDEELAELDAVLAGERRFAELPPRV